MRPVETYVYAVNWHIDLTGHFINNLMNGTNGIINVYNRSFRNTIIHARPTDAQYFQCLLIFIVTHQPTSYGANFRTANIQSHYDTLSNARRHHSHTI
jgi:hypothetical protein